jgi:hypothetical protein
MIAEKEKAGAGAAREKQVRGEPDIQRWWWSLNCQGPDHNGRAKEDEGCRPNCGCSEGQV